jgi:hypothetical protein
MAADEPVPPGVKEFFRRLGKKYGAFGAKKPAVNVTA